MTSNGKGSVDLNDDELRPSASVRPLCCVQECDELAIGEIHAHWTVLDFISRASCGPHMEYVYQVTARSTIDSQLPHVISSKIWALEDNDE